MKKNIKSKIGIFFKSFAVFIVLLTMTFFLSIQNHQLYLDEYHNSTLSQTAVIRSNLEHQINTTLNLTLGLVVYIAANPDITDKEFSKLAQQIMQRNNLFRNVGLAKDNVISHMYPLEGNEKALGLSYLDTPSQREGVLRALNSKEIVIVGPLELVQGGQAFISRIPVFLDEQQTDYWGIASIVMDAEVLYESTGLNKSMKFVDFALQGRDNVGISEKVFYGDASIFESKDSIVLPIHVANNEWLIATRFNFQDVSFSIRTLVIFFFGLVISVIISIAVYFLLMTFRRIEHLAAYDSLTELANRHLFNDHLQESIGRYIRNKINFSVLLLDLDNFKEVNDSLGHPVGDKLLQAVAHRLKKISRNTDVVARLGGDEFIILQNDVSELTDSARFAQKILDEFKQVFILDKIQLHTSASIGIVTCKIDTLTPEIFMKYSDLALYKAKHSGRSTFKFHDEAMSLSLLHEIELTADIKQAIEKNQFYMVYQPQINLRNNALMGAEALIRWEHPVKGIIPPVEFIPVAEKRGLISDIGLWGLNEVCRQARIWLEEGLHFEKIALNISAQHIKSTDFTQQILSALAKHQISPAYLELELTESSFVDNFENIQLVMQDLGKKGVNFAIDDFGTGYSSLAYIKNLNVTYLKIDYIFVKDMLVDESDKEIIKATIDMAKALEMVTIAEGIEEQEQADILTEMGCDIGQGYLFHHPMKANDFAQEPWKSLNSKK
ncbi:MAG: bifunctional diguanylate cyclase/phosphodiesterase [gamma proteobacterium symbiont of Bathyaustriella thionipta]|nr:bifunctional diguanylate cyclase/phosphodiesterase [gamma proteobacterium symbiont of Bathyaustriella thionipta]MCU7951061.1 bifunctional diguanylate cyclase/phosphodiesterase [gamma proteobacterium symbiont of Bathyaustriella thionipta]MCU7953815.1 bifunctional diguanylate cyclase/phosphodiesterase [gamma proteobacterium symbiont of Bathyaustriella thionipta]MCU7957598.1 bifunctional diguanylate cyclase/phosphodiesterase [gamma proteobacterium symbiont of Bathyaustriella thionipta]MCU796688